MGALEIAVPHCGSFRVSGLSRTRVVAASFWMLAALTGPQPAVAASTSPTAATYETLTSTWPGPYGGLPPLALATPAALESAYLEAIEAKRAQVHAIAVDPASPTFENTIAALDASGLPLLRIERVLQELLATASTPELRAVAGRVVPKAAGLDDEIALDRALFARVAAVHGAKRAAGRTTDKDRLTDLTYRSFLRRGANLDPAQGERLKAINAQLATLVGRFASNLAREEESLVVFVDSADDLRGLPADRIATAKSVATTRGKPESWAIPMQRPAVWPVLLHAQSRALRERVYRLWASRGDNRGEFDNAPITREILRLRGEKATLLGYPSYAHFATSDRMAGTPEAAGALLDRTWALLLPKTREELAALQALANSEGADFEVAAWDRLYYAEKLRQRDFKLDAEAVRPYLTLQNVTQGMMWAAGRVYGISFRELHGVPVVAPDIRVYEVRRGGDVLGVLYVDMFQRPGKGPASWASELRPAERGKPRVLPVVALHSNVVKPTDGTPPLLTWEVANVIFHEFGHTLHMLSSTARYRAFEPLRMPWDFIEVPSLLNERWLLDRAVLERFARHHRTGEAIPEALIAKVERAFKHDRVFSVNLDYLQTAIVDLRVHLLADGRPLDAVEEQARILRELDAPAAIPPLLGVSHAVHTFTEAYGAGVYTYLWSDVIAADIAEVFLEAPGALYDPRVAAKYRRLILDPANARPVADSFREFRGRDPSPEALFRRFDLLRAKAGDPIVLSRPRAERHP